MSKEINLNQSENLEKNIEQEEQDIDDSIHLEENLEQAKEPSEKNSTNERNLEEDIKLLKDQLLRAVAEVENTKRRSKKENEETAKFAISNFVRDLINVAENLERATEAITPEIISENPLVKTISEGVEMTKRELFAVFEKNNIIRIFPIKGDKFDHNYHQAISNTKDSDVEAGNIVAVMQAGYMINDRLLKPAIVTVAS